MKTIYEYLRKRIYKTCFVVTNRCLELILPVNRINIRYSCDGLVGSAFALRAECWGTIPGRYLPKLEVVTALLCNNYEWHKSSKTNLNGRPLS